MPPIGTTARVEPLWKKSASCTASTTDRGKTTRPQICSLTGRDAHLQAQPPLLIEEPGTACSAMVIFTGHHPLS